ncbi:MAG: hypothetical protein BZ133_08265 [Methanosphaera sp. SHI613]|jgi:tRNA-guanine family transglycosylase|nr:MAG: hypothetical protein BZ133_08265 [Methanosphaera sp. SHI613]
MIKIKSHDGPARLGQLDDTITPTVIDYKSVEKVRNIKTPFKIQEEIAEEYTEESISLATQEEDKSKYAVIQGAQYTNLRVECAKQLEKEGFTKLIFANPDELLRNPKDLLDIIITCRQNLNTTTALYFPFAPTQLLAILTYIGIDIFDNSRAIYESRNNNLMTTTNIYPQEKYNIVDDIYKENINQLNFAIKEIQENIKNKTLRNLTEQKATTSPEAMTLHRLLDKNYGEYLLKYTQLY